MDAPTLHAFLRRLQHDRVLHLDLRATLAVEALLEQILADAAAGEPWSRDSERAAIASILARDEAEWKAIDARLKAFFGAPRAFLAGEVQIREPGATTPQPPGGGDVIVLVPSASLAARWQRLLAALRARAGALRRRVFSLPRSVLGWLLALTSLSAVVVLILGAVVSVRWLLEPPPGTVPTTTHDPAASDPVPELEKAAAQKPDAKAAAAPLPIEARKELAKPPPPPPPPDLLGEVLRGQPEANATARYATGIVVWLVSLLFAAIGIRWLRTQSLQKVAQEQQQRRALDLRRQQAEDDDAQTLLYAVTRFAPLPIAAIDDAAVILGRIAELGRGDDLDIDATLDATIRAAGRFAPTFAPICRQHHVTVLVDIETGSHPYLHAFLFVLARWHQLGVKIERHDFKHRPRRVEPRPVDADNDLLRTELTPRLDLGALARRSDGSPLLIVSRMADLAEKTGAMPWLRHLAAWPVRAVLDLDPRPLADRDGEAQRVALRLREAGVRRFPFTPAGLSAMAMHLTYGTGTPAPEPTLAPWREVLPALRRWAALAACVPDPTWVQLEAFRRHFDELERALPDPRYLQRMLDWLRSEKENPISADGRRLAISDTLVNRLLNELRTAEGLAPGELSATERRARELIMQQIAAATPSSGAMSDRCAMRLAFHRAVLEPVRADDLLPFFSSAQAPELQAMLRRHLARVPHPSGTAWRAVGERLVEGTGGPVLLKHMLARPWWARVDLPLQVATASLTGAAWATLLIESSARATIAGVVGVVGLGVSVAVHRRQRAVEPPVEPPVESPVESRGPVIEDPPTGRVLGPGPVALAAVAPMHFVRLSGGEFTMGSRASGGEIPPHRVSLPPFEIATTPVTVRQWRAVMTSVPGNNKSGDDCPVVNVSWLDAIEFLNRLSDDSGLPRCYASEGDELRWNWAAEGYRLPTEAEWEYAARAGTTTQYSFEDAAIDQYAWHSGNSGGGIRPVGTRKKNPFGLHDMHGNVWEWVQDWYAPYDYQAAADSGGPPKGDGRVLRGGSFADVPVNLRSAVRSWLWPSRAYWGRGFRVARGARPQRYLSTILRHGRD